MSDILQQLSVQFWWLESRLSWHGSELSVEKQIISV